MSKEYYMFFEIKCPECNELIKIGFGVGAFISCEGVRCQCGREIIEKVYKKEID